MYAYNDGKMLQGCHIIIMWKMCENLKMKIKSNV